MTVGRRHCQLGTALVIVATIAVSGCGHETESLASEGESQLAPSPPIDVTPTAPALNGPGEFGRRFDIGGRKMYLQCRGTGSPTVILFSGYGNGADIWDIAESNQLGVAPSLAKTTRVCAYDRPGSTLQALPNGKPGRSDPVPGPRTSTDVVKELHSLLSVAGIEGPYVLVGHSLGGFFQYQFARTYPREILGMVAVDGVPATIKEFLSPVVWKQAYQDALLHPQQIPGVKNFEAYDMDASFAEAAAIGTTPKIPLTALVAANLESGTPLARDFTAAWKPAQDAYAKGFPDSRVTVVGGTTHYIQSQRPSVVVDAVVSMIANTTPRGSGK